MLGVLSDDRLQSAIAVHLGSYHSCAVVAGQELICWGEGSDGQLGNDSTVAAYGPTYVLA